MKKQLSLIFLSIFFLGITTVNAQENYEPMRWVKIPPLNNVNGGEPLTFELIGGEPFIKIVNGKDVPYYTWKVSAKKMAHDVVIRNPLKFLEDESSSTKRMYTVNNCDNSDKKGYTVVTVIDAKGKKLSTAFSCGVGVGETGYRQLPPVGIINPVHQGIDTSEITQKRISGYNLAYSDNVDMYVFARSNYPGVSYEWNIVEGRENVILKHDGGPIAAIRARKTCQERSGAHYAAIEVRDSEGQVSRTFVIHEDGKFHKDEQFRCAKSKAPLTRNIDIFKINGDKNIQHMFSAIDGNFLVYDSRSTAYRANSECNAPSACLVYPEECDSEECCMETGLKEPQQSYCFRCEGEDESVCGECEDGETREKEKKEEPEDSIEWENKCGVCAEDEDKEEEKVMEVCCNGEWSVPKKQYCLYKKMECFEDEVAIEDYCKKIDCLDLVQEKRCENGELKWFSDDFEKKEQFYQSVEGHDDMYVEEECSDILLEEQESKSPIDEMKSFNSLEEAIEYYDGLAQASGGYTRSNNTPGFSNRELEDRLEKMRLSDRFVLRNVPYYSHVTVIIDGFYRGRTDPVSESLHPALSLLKRISLKDEFTDEDFYDKWYGLNDPVVQDYFEEVKCKTEHCGPWEKAEEGFYAVINKMDYYDFCDDKPEEGEAEKDKKTREDEERKTVAHLIKTKKGVCRNFAATLSSLYNYIGIKSEMIPATYAHAIVYVEINGIEFFLDPTSMKQFVPLRPSVKMYDSESGY